MIKCSIALADARRLMAYMLCRFATFRAVSKACMMWRLSMDDLQVCLLANVPIRPAARLSQGQSILKSS